MMIMMAMAVMTVMMVMTMRDDDDDDDDDDDNDDDDDDDIAGEHLMSALHPGVEPGTFLRFDDMIWMMMSLIIAFIRCSLVATSSW